MSLLYGALYRNILFPLYESGVRRRSIPAHLRELQRTQWWSRSDLKALQAQKLRALLEHAYLNVPFYRERLRRADLLPSDFRSVEDLHHLPVLTREEAANQADARQATAGARIDIRKSTSGSTGRPLLFGYDRASEDRRQAMRWRGYGWSGLRPGDKAVYFWGSLAVLYPPGWKKQLKTELDHLLRREYYLDCTRHGRESLERTVQFIARKQPKALVCYAQAGVALARYVLERGIREWDELPVLCGAERLFPADRAVLEAAFGPAFETYGSREVMLMAAECEAHQGMHTSMEHLIVEVAVQTADGSYRPAKPGETGEVLVTDLTNYGMPFIRYANGDLAVREDEGTCDCGRSLTRLRSVEGRKNDVLFDADGQPINNLFFNVLFSVLGDSVRQFQVVQRSDRSVDLKVVPTARFDARLVQSINDNCRKILGVPSRVHVVDDIPVSANGKYRVVVTEPPAPAAE